ncbi:hypothetical protein GCM10025773_07480 [Microbacterium jejuense]
MASFAPRIARNGVRLVAVFGRPSVVWAPVTPAVFSVVMLRWSRRGGCRGLQIRDNLGRCVRHRVSERPATVAA